MSSDPQYRPELWPEEMRSWCVAIGDRVRGGIVSPARLGYTDVMMMRVRRCMVIGMLAVTAGCASTSVIPESLEQQVDKSVTFSQVLESPDSYRGKVVLLGGEVLRAKAMRGGTQLEVLQLPLGDDQEPVTERRESKGRFLAVQKDFLDPATIADGARVTIVGEITGASVKK